MAVEGVSWVPRLTRVLERVQHTADTVSLKLDLSLNHQPGQFVQVSVPGVGEIPLSVASFPGDRLMITFRRVGRVTAALYGLGVGDSIGVRGPFGRGFPLEGGDVLLVAGGMGLPPIRSALGSILRERDRFGTVQLLYGARRPSLLLYKEEYDAWRRGDVVVSLIVDEAEDGWRGRVGVVTELFDKLEVGSDATVLVCGPEIMMKFVGGGLLKMGFDPKRIYMSMERHMKCGVGLCGHCNIGPYYVCRDGPVFDFETLRNIPESGVI